MYSLSGITISEGAASAPAVILTTAADKISLLSDESLLKPLDDEPVDGILDPAYELSKFHQKSHDFAAKLRHVTSAAAPDSVRDLFGAVSAYLTDPKNAQIIGDLIYQGKSAARACRLVFLDNLKVFTDSDDPELKAQGRELTALAKEFIATLSTQTPSEFNHIELKEPSVIVAKDLTPAHFLCLRTDLVRAVVLEGGMSSGHLGSVLRELRIPAVFSVVGASAIKNGEQILVDGSEGSVIVEPPSEAAAFLLERQAVTDEDVDDDEPLSITLAPSVGASKELDLSSHLLKHGLGLLRSEFLFLGSKKEPSEDEMTQTFASLFSKVPSHAPIAARTFDFAGDKTPVFPLVLDESGPLQGYGAHVSSDLLKKELKALLKAAPNRELSVVFPLISRISEAKCLNNLLATCAEELDAQGKARAEFKTVLMIETPAAVLSARAFTEHTSMFLIGTSSLDEYASAPRTPGQAFTPALAKMIAIACKGAYEGGVKVGAAGRFAQRPELLPFFLKLGVSYISTDAYSMTKLKSCLEGGRLKSAYEEDFYQKIMNTATGQEIASLINNLNFI